MKHLLTLEDWSAEEMAEAIATARAIKADPARYENCMRRRTLCMIFEKPSLRTRLSFECSPANTLTAAQQEPQQRTQLNYTNLLTH